MHNFKRKNGPRTLDLNSVNRAATAMVRFVLLPGVHLTLALGWALFVFGVATHTAGAMSLHMAASYAHAATFGDGASPAAMQTGNMPQAGLTVHYNKAFMKFLAKKLNKLQLCTRMTMPEKSGLTFRNFMLTPPIGQQTQGTIGSPITITCNFRDIVMGQWADYTNFSDLTFMTSISDDLMNYRRMMAYRLAQTIDTLIMINLDYLRTLDGNTANQDSLVGPLYAFTKQIIEQMPPSLFGQNVAPMSTGYFYGSIHPFFVGDMFALDNTNNSVVDILKHTPEGQMKLEELMDDDDDGEIRVLELAGVRWLRSTNQTTTANWQGSGLTAISTYCAGEDAMVFVNLPSAKHTDPHPKWENMDLWAGEYARSSYDPAGVIAAGTAYNCILGIGPSPDNVSRARIAKAVPQTT
jgi:hypothetical protein